MGGRVAGLVEKQSSSVFGRLFEISAKDWPVVQHKEGVITGMSIELKVNVTIDNKVVEAIAFTTTPTRASTIGPISERFIDALIRGATHSGLPKKYIDTLKSKAI